MSATKFAPTPEQERALELFATGESMKIEAGAGTGKTSTLLLLAESAPQRRGQYIAFNRSIVEESKTKFPSSVKCSTAHSLAFASFGKLHMPRIKSSARMKSSDVAAFLGIDGIALDVAGERKWLSPSKLAGITLRAVERFCQSADAEPGAHHVPYVKGIDFPPVVGGRRNRANNDQVARYLLPFVRKAWDDIRKTEGRLPSGHHVYLKLWQLSSPRINADYILFDEAQDASPVMVDVVSKQTAQVVWVGDSQQEIYGFTGAINALATIPTPHRTFLTKSFRFGPAVAGQANEILSMIPAAELRLVGHDPIPSQVAPLDAPDAVLCRTNAEAVRVVLEVLGEGKRPHLVGGGTEIVAFAKGAQTLIESGWSSHPDLACFTSWAEVQDYVEQDEQGDDLRLLVRLVDEFGVDRILAALDSNIREDQADLIVSTAHKSKGREWDAVQLAADFPEEPEKASAEELRLLYVACTRARLTLDITRVALLSNGSSVPAASAEVADSDEGDGPAPAPVALVSADAPARVEPVIGGTVQFLAAALLRMDDQIKNLGVDLDVDYQAELAVARRLVEG